jgi:hypothetical protein
MLQRACRRPICGELSVGVRQSPQCRYLTKQVGPNGDYVPITKDLKVEVGFGSVTLVSTQAAARNDIQTCKIPGGLLQAGQPSQNPGKSRPVPSQPQTATSSRQSDVVTGPRAEPGDTVSHLRPELHIADSPDNDRRSPRSRLPDRYDQV